MARPAAGRALPAFVEAHDEILFLVSWRRFRVVEVALAPHTDGLKWRTRNARLIASGLTIAEINRERRKLSAIKGGNCASACAAVA